MSTYSPNQDPLEQLRMNVRSTSGLNVIAGIWLFASPWIFGFEDHTAAWMSAVATGAAITVLAAYRSTIAFTWAPPSWLNMAAGIWTFFSPWLLGFDSVDAALWNDLAVGAAVLILAMMSASATAHYGEEEARRRF